MRAEINRLYDQGGKWMWGGLLILLPVTSMPLVRDLVRSSTVAAPSVVLLGLLLAGWLIPYLVKGARLPMQTIPLLAFFCAVVLSFGAGLILPQPPLKNVNPFSHSITSVITLVIGLCFFMLPALMVREEDSLKSTLRWINLGGMLILGWSFFQAAVWFGQGHYWNWMRDIQDLFSLGPLYRGRVTGFALEPSWLAHQLNMLYLPLWLASSVQKFSVYRFRLAGLTVENLLAAAGGLTLALSFSRIGWLGFFAVLTFVFILANFRLVRWLGKKLRGRLLAAIMTFALVLVYLAGVVGAAYIMSKVDPRMEDLFKASFWQQDTALVLANSLQFGERVVYWQAGWEVFNQHPWLGVGPGNAGFYFSQTIPSFGWKLIEVRQLIYRAAEIPNTKNLWIRLLAETGIVGLACFLAFCSSILQTARFLLRRASRSEKMMGMMGLFVLIGLVLEGFSIDSFALPYYWISFGLVSAAASMAAGSRFADDHD
ncbi:MAG: O-antigen ligase family protein [Anaerolineaceae bacterium]